LNDAEQFLHEGVDSFSQGCTLFKQQSADALAVGRQIREKILLARNNLGFFDRMVSACRHHLSDMEQVAHILIPFSEDVSDDWREEEKNIRARYTMQREREAHQNMFNSIAPVSKAPSLPLPETVQGKRADLASDSDIGEDEFDDNVELF
jgi:hypothetical protein